jgi:glycosyltransferase involved in cell wall biosynthesis
LPDHGAFPELIDSTGGGLVVEPGSPEAVAKGIQELMNDAEKRHAMGKSGKAAVHDKFSDAVMAARTVSVYDSVLKRIN